MAALLSLGRPVAWDITVCTTVAASYVTPVSQSAGAAAVDFSFFVFNPGDIYYLWYK